ncbi:MAG: deiodinase-like protein [Gammaproteobacteria bacterium]
MPAKDVPDPDALKDTVDKWVSEEQWHIENATVDVRQFMTGLNVGDVVADAPVYSPEGVETALSTLWSAKPALLLSGSISCPPSRALNPAANTLQQEFGEQLQLAVLYVIDAHPDGDLCPYTGTSWLSKTNEDENVRVAQPRDQAERNALAARYRDLLGLQVPVLVDNMDNTGWAALGKAPNTVVLVDTAGRCRHCDVWFRPAELPQVLIPLLNGLA